MNKMKKEATILLLLVLLWCGSIIGAPFMVSLGGFFELLSVLLYKSFGVICHRFESHTFHIDAHPFAVCIRCTAIYFGFLLGIFSMLFLKKALYRMNARILLPIVSFPIFIDGAFSLLGWYDATTFTRLFTGGIFGFGVSLALYNSLIEIISSLLHSTTINYESTT